MNPRQALEEFLLAGQADGLRPATLKWYESTLANFVEAYQTHDMASISTRDLRQYVVSLRNKSARYTNAPQKPEQAGGLSLESLASYITALHRFWAWYSAETDSPNPMKAIKRPRRPDPEPKAISEQDFVRLFNATNETRAGIRDRALLAMLADTGARLGGLLTLTDETLDRARRRARVTEKGRRTRTIYYTRTTAQLLDAWLIVRPKDAQAIFTDTREGRALTASGIHEILKRLKKRAGVEGRVNPHSFRHRFARAYVSNGGDIATLATILGHANIATTADYYAVFDEDELAEFHDRHSPMSSNPPTD